MKNIITNFDNINFDKLLKTLKSELNQDYNGDSTSVCFEDAVIQTVYDGTIAAKRGTFLEKWIIEDCKWPCITKLANKGDTIFNKKRLEIKTCIITQQSRRQNYFNYAHISSNCDSYLLIGLDLTENKPIAQYFYFSKEELRYSFGLPQSIHNKSLTIPIYKKLKIVQKKTKKNMNVYKLLKKITPFLKKVLLNL